MVHAHNKAVRLSYLITQKKIKMLFDNVFPEKDKVAGNQDHAKQAIKKCLKAEFFQSP